LKECGIVVLIIAFVTIIATLKGEGVIIESKIELPNPALLRSGTGEQPDS